MKRFNQPYCIIPGFYFSSLLTKEVELFFCFPNETLSELVECLFFELPYPKVELEQLL